MLDFSSLKKLNPIDSGIFALVALALIGILFVQAGWHQTSSQMIEGESDVLITFITRNTRTVDPNLFKKGAVTHITIRNQPRGDLPIESSSFSKVKTLVPLANGTVKVLDDPSLIDAYDFRVTLKDHALVTPEGYVSNGIKLKIGLPIEIEGFNYRLGGVIVDVQPLPEAASQAKVQ